MGQSVVMYKPQYQTSLAGANAPVKAVVLTGGACIKAGLWLVWPTQGEGVHRMRGLRGG